MGMYFPHGCKIPDRTIFEKTITPDEARRMLEKNSPSQRHKKELKITTFAEDMGSGKWDPYCGDLIRVSETGYVIDGQNRLEAIIRSGEPQTCLYAEGFMDSDFVKIDGGTSRKGGDSLKGIKNANLTAAIVRMWYAYEKHGLNQMVFKAPISNAEIADMYATDTPLFLKAVDVANSIRQSVTCGSAAAYGFAYLLAASVDEGLAEEFVEGLAGDYCVNKTFTVFKRWATRRATNGKKLHAEDVFKALTLVWNAVAEGREINSISYHKEDRLKFAGITYPLKRGSE